MLVNKDWKDTIENYLKRNNIYKSVIRAIDFFIKQQARASRDSTINISTRLLINSRYKLRIIDANEEGLFTLGECAFHLIVDNGRYIIEAHIGIKVNKSITLDDMQLELSES